MPDNLWRFLFRTSSKFELSVSVQKARSMPNGNSMLKALFSGGLCSVAVQFYKPDIDAPTMCRELLDEQLVSMQSCEAAKMANAVNVGSTVAGAALGVMGVPALAAPVLDATAWAAGRSWRESEPSLPCAPF